MNPERQAQVAADAAFDRLLALETQLLAVLGNRGSDHPVRNAFAIVRGHMELAQCYDMPLDIKSVEKMLVEIVQCMVKPRKLRREYLVSISENAGWIKLHNLSLPASVLLVTEQVAA